MKKQVFALLCVLSVWIAEVVLADDASMEQRLLSLELRVQQLEALIARSMASSPGGAAVVPPTRTPPTTSGPGRFNEQNAPRRAIELNANGTFVLLTSTGKFTGTWEGQDSDAVLIRTDAGLTERFRWEGGHLVDSRGGRWHRAAP